MRKFLQELWKMKLVIFFFIFFLLAKDDLTRILSAISMIAVALEIKIEDMFKKYCKNNKK